MTGASSLRLTLTVGALSLAACGESSSPTQPEAPVPATSVPSFAQVSNTWTPRAAFPDPEGREFSLGVVPNSAGQSIVYAFGGTDMMGGSCFPTQIYNASTNAWSGSKSTPVCERSTNGVGRIKGKLYLTGGYAGQFADGLSASTFMYDPVTDKLTRKADTPKFTAEGVSGVIQDKLYVLPGACDGSRWPAVGYCDHTEFLRLWRYNPATNLWATKRLAPHNHLLGAGGAINGKFYVVGGRSAGSNNLDVYDPVTDTWKTLAPLPLAGRATGTVVLGKLFVVAWNENNFPAGPRLYAYNPATNTWASKASPSHRGPVVRVDIGGVPYLLLVSGTGSELYKP